MRIGLLEAEPELARFLDPDEAERAAGVYLPMQTLHGEFDPAELFDEQRAFGALIIDGMVLQRVQVGEQPTLRLIGPGDLLSPSMASSRLLPRSVYTAIAETQVAILADRVLAAGQHWPRLFAALSLKAAEQAERVTVQLAICQLPRVTDRLLAQMWLLAETWGRVTPAGVRLPIALTHDLLGGMIGARRPTVTLALGELAERGAIIRQDLGWLLLEQFAAHDPIEARSDVPTLLGRERSAWLTPPASALPPAWTHAELMASIARLRTEHMASRDHVRQRLANAEATREQVNQRRARIGKSGPRQAPS